jgi:PH/SEC7 domain-containing protein
MGDNRQSMMSISSAGVSRRSTMRSPSDRVNKLKRGSIRGVQGLGNNPYGANFANSDGRLSPTPSYATSINESGFAAFTPTLGFASNLSHTVIKEQEDEARSVDSRVTTSTIGEMSDHELALLGAPWAKEGTLTRKLYYESTGKRSAKKEWKQYFVVLEKGELHMFTFGEKSSSQGYGGHDIGAAVGGGNWMVSDDWGRWLIAEQRAVYRRHESDARYGDCPSQTGIQRQPALLL